MEPAKRATSRELVAAPRLRKILFAGNPRLAEVITYFTHHALQQPEGLRESSRGSKRSADPRISRRAIRTLKGCKILFLGPLQGHESFLTRSGGIARRCALNPRLLSCSPFGLLQQLLPLSAMLKSYRMHIEVLNYARARAPIRAAAVRQGLMPNNQVAGLPWNRHGA